MRFKLYCLLSRINSEKSQESTKRFVLSKPRMNDWRRRVRRTPERRSSNSVRLLDEFTMVPYRRPAGQSLSWSACRSSSVALATSWACRKSTSGLTCCAVEFDRLTEFPLPNFGRGILTRCTSLSQDSMVTSLPSLGPLEWIWGINFSLSLISLPYLTMTVIQSWWYAKKSNYLMWLFIINGGKKISRASILDYSRMERKCS